MMTQTSTETYMVLDWTRACTDNDLESLKRVCKYSTVYRKQPGTCYSGFRVAVDSGYLSIVKFILEESGLQLRDIVDPVVFAQHLLNGQVAKSVLEYFLDGPALLPKLEVLEVAAIVHQSIIAQNLNLLRALVEKACPVPDNLREACLKHSIRENWRPGFELLFNQWNIPLSGLDKYLDYADSLGHSAFKCSYLESNSQAEIDNVKQPDPGEPEFKDVKRNPHPTAVETKQDEPEFKDTKRNPHPTAVETKQDEPGLDVKHHLPPTEIKWHPRLNILIKEHKLNPETFSDMYQLVSKDVKYKMLYRACQLGNLEVVQFLVPEYGLTPGPGCLEAACLGKHSKLVDWLVQKSGGKTCPEPEVKVPESSNMLAQACRAGSLDVVQVLVEQDKMVPNARCLTAALDGKHLEIADWLVWKAGVKPSKRYRLLVDKVRGFKLRPLA